MRAPGGYHAAKIRRHGALSGVSFVKRPMSWVAVAFVAGMGAAGVGAIPGWGIPLCVALGGLAVAWLYSDRFASRSISVSATAFAAGALLWNARSTGEIGDPISRYAAAHPQQTEWTLEGVVRLTDLEDSQSGFRQFVLDVDTVRAGGQTQSLRGSAMVCQFKPDGDPVYATQRLRAEGTLALAMGRVNPGVRGYESYLRSKDIHTVLTVRERDGVEALSSGCRWSPAYWASVMRRIQADRMARFVPPGALGFANAIWLGYRGRIPAKEYQSFVESGTVHILSVSGIHMAMLFWTVSMLGGLLTRSRRRQALIAITTIVLFTLMSGLRAGTLRAALMIAVYLLADLLNRERDARTALAVSAVLLLGWNPRLLYDTGFQLSFLSVASLLLFTETIVAAVGRAAEWIRGPQMPFGIDPGRMTGGRAIIAHLRALSWPDSWRWNAQSLWRRARDVVAASIAVQILAWPVVIGSFHVAPLVAPLANLFVIPLATAALWLCFITQAAGLFSEGLAQIFGHALGPIVWGIQAVANGAARPSWAHPILTSPTMPAMACYWGAALLWAAHIETPSRWKRLAPAAALAAACIVCWTPWRQEPVAVFLDVGHGDCTFVRWADGRTMLVDGGDRRGEQDQGRNTVAPFLWSNHAARLDCIVLSHPDRDHIGGLLYLLERFDVGTLILGPHAPDRPLEHELIQTCNRKNVSIRRMRAGEKLVLGAMQAEALHPPDSDFGSDVNNSSLVLRLHWSGIRILLPGDIETPAEIRLAGEDCAADVLKVPHHGSRTSSSSALLQAVRPAVAVISTGGEHGREHVDPGVVEGYRRAGIPLWRTDWHGGIVLRVQNDAVNIIGERVKRGYPCPPTPDNVSFPLPPGRRI